MKDSELWIFFSVTKNAMLILKSDIIYGSKRTTSGEVKQTGVRQHNTAKATLERSQPWKGIASKHESNEIRNLFLDLTPQARRKSPKENSRDNEARHGIRRVALRVLGSRS